jgi:RNA-directed DNA polymerase
MIVINKKPETPINKIFTNAAIRSAESWNSINWGYIRVIVKKLQLRIAKATLDRKFRKVKTLQWLLTHSLSAKLLATRKVMQNKGSKTPGIDGIIIKTPETKLALAKNLKRRGYQPSPLRRIYIPKKGNKKKLRPLGIPTITDRCQQGLHALALTPVSEVTADLNSYGFRPYRSCADAISQVFNALSRKNSSPWILEGDIKGCFDHISHNWLRNNISMDKSIMNKWLKAGFIDMGKLFPTIEGTPQGGLISPLMCNMALDGIGDLLKNKFNKQKGINFIRYADDFIVTCRYKETLEKEIKPAITDFLKQRGLELSQDKTRITHITEGFDFLGQNVRKYSSGNELKLLIKPSKKNIHSFLKDIRKVLRKARSITQSELIRILNPKIIGWGNYHKSVVSKETFTKIDNEIWKLTYQWAKRRHSKKTKPWILHKYFKRFKGRSFRFSSPEVQENGTIQEQRLMLMSTIPIRRHVKILQSANPYEEKYDEYFEKRISEKWKNSSKRFYIDRYINMNQKGKCLCCSEALMISQNWCISLKRKISKGGGHQSDNFDVIHKKCYEKWQSKRTA